MEELLQDRIARSGVASAASLLGTWHRFQREAFGDASLASDTLPVIVRSIVTIGIFKRGGYRSFANYISAIKAEHIEAGYNWTQLLAHTSGWVRRIRETLQAPTATAAGGTKRTSAAGAPRTAGYDIPPSRGGGQHGIGISLVVR